MDNITPGRIVHFFPSTNGEGLQLLQMEFAPAIVTKVVDGAINLNVFTDFAGDPVQQAWNVKQKTDAAKGEQHWVWPQQIPARQEPKPMEQQQATAKELSGAPL